MIFMNSILNKIYNLYKDKVNYCSSMWKSEYSCSREEDEDRDLYDKEDLKYFEELLRQIDNNFTIEK